MIYINNGIANNGEFKPIAQEYTAYGNSTTNVIRHYSQNPNAKSLQDLLINLMIKDIKNTQSQGSFLQ